MKKMDKELLHRYLEQGGDAGVRESLREWFLEHDADAELSLPEDDPVGEELHAFWERSLRRAASQRTPVDRYRALSERLFGRKLRMQRFWRRVSQVAAVLLVPLVVCAYLFASQPASEPAEWVEVYAPYGQTRQVTLPDGSRVWLNSGTYVFYPDRFDRERRLFVSGEAYMDVTKDPDRPFRVDTRNVSIRVLGTRFNVRSYTGDKYVETSLLEGSVSLELKRESGTAILMRPGDKILVDNATDAVVHERFDCAHYSSWRDGFHTFRHKSLGEIARDLERIFDVQIVIRDASLPDEEYFATFASGWEIDELLDALNIRHTLRIRRDGRIIEIERAR
ncbi:FecR family protein [Alistipes sp.]|uniref:FecR family protein n=1 Tax=Alistipes sp. TaxID=1872444 RepID=UPI003A850AB1